MNEAQQRQSRVRPIGLESPYSVPLRAIRLAVVPQDHADVMTTARQRLSEKRLLNRFTADGVVSVCRRQDRQIIESDEADLHPVTHPWAVLGASNEGAPDLYQNETLLHHLPVERVAQ
jgi:hypothetical protein